MIFVGDTKRDMLSGVIAGVLPVGFDGGFGGLKTLIESGAKHIITDHEQIFFSARIILTRFLYCKMVFKAKKRKKFFAYLQNLLNSKKVDNSQYRL